MNRITRLVTVVEIALAAIGLAAAWWLGLPILEGTRIDTTALLLSAALTVPLALVTIGGVTRSSIPFVVEFRKKLEETVLPMFAGYSVPELALVAIMAGVGEEIFFRGFLQLWLGGLLNPWVALLLVSILFGVVHYVSHAYALFAGLIGLYLGLVLMLTGNLFVAIAIHALYDFVALLYLLREKPAPADSPAATVE
jgi:membrane protease YdiL (CAAX protease family)